MKRIASLAAIMSFALTSAAAAASCSHLVSLPTGETACIDRGVLKSAHLHCKADPLECSRPFVDACYPRLGGSPDSPECAAAKAAFKAWAAIHDACYDFNNARRTDAAAVANCSNIWSK